MARAKSASLSPGRGRKLTVGFGLVNVPLVIKPLAESTRPIPGKLMCPEHGPTLNSRLVCSIDTVNEHMLDRSETIKGYPHPDQSDVYVPLDEGVLDEIEEARSGTAEITKVVAVESIDPAYYEKSYLCWPQDGGEQAFDLLAAALRTGKKAAVTTTVLTKQTQTVVLRWSETFNAVLAHVVRFDSQLRHQDAELVQHVAAARPEPAKELLAMAEQVLATKAGEWDASDAEDTLTPLLADAIRAAADGGTFEPVKLVAPASPTVDLMAALKASIAEKEEAKKPTRTRAKKAA